MNQWYHLSLEFFKGDIVTGMSSIHCLCVMFKVIDFALSVGIKFSFFRGFG
jgi:hypothetical protein